MKKNISLIIAACLLASCDQPQKEPKVTPPTGDESKQHTSMGESKTPFNQLENKYDRAITQKIRKAIVANKNLSMNAKNIKIISEEGFVTLRGWVNSDEEKLLIDKITRNTSGVNKVDNQLEITAKE